MTTNTPYQMDESLVAMIKRWMDALDNREIADRLDQQPCIYPPESMTPTAAELRRRLRELNVVEDSDS